MTKLFSIILILILFKPISAQQNTLKDFLPLSLGNKWQYSFYSDSYNIMSHSSVSDTGNVELDIIGKKDSANCTIWHFIQRRSYKMKAYISYGWNYASVKDSATFDLVEVINGNHELYTASYNYSKIFPFAKTSFDSLKIFRYYSNDIGNLIKNITYETVDYTDAHNITFSSDVGIIQLVSNYGSMFGGASNRYHFQEFHPGYPEPHLRIPNNIYAISTLTGIPKDSTIIIVNDGLQPLILTAVESNNQRFSVIGFSKIIPPISNGSITIRFNSDVSETVLASLDITCNSYNTTNKLALSGKTYLAAICTIQPSLPIYLGFAYHNEVAKGTYSIFNKGNSILLIDSIKSNNSVFFTKNQKIIALPGQSVVDTIYFAPTTSATYMGKISIFSNSSTSPDSIIINAISFEKPMIIEDPKQISFGIHSIGETKDTSIIITNNGNESIFLNASVILDVNVHFLERFPFLVGNKYLYFDTEIKPHSTCQEVIFYIPRSNGKVTGHINNHYTNSGYTVLETNINLVGGDSPESVVKNTDLTPKEFLLSQNYPNPFNPSTVINFGIPKPSHVSLIIYDILGREVASLVNENKSAGYYSITYNAKNLPSGIYFYKIQADNFSSVKKMILMR